MQLSELDQKYEWNYFLKVYISKSFVCHSFSHVRQEEIKIANEIAGVS